MTTITAADLKNVVFFTPPSDMGKIVEVSYGLYGGMQVICRVRDTGTNTVTYETGVLADEDFEPWQCAPEVEYGFSPLSIS